MTTRNPDPDSPPGPSVAEPGPQVGTGDSQALLDAGSSTAEEGPAGVPQGMVDISEQVREGNPPGPARSEREGAPAGPAKGAQTGVAGIDDAMAPQDTGLPTGTSAGRGEGAGHQTGGATTSGR